jgi:hypothetical protein
MAPAGPAALAVAALAVGLGLGCGSPRAAPVVPSAVPAESLSIAVYSGKGRAYAVVDDRRTIEVTGRTILLDRIDPAAALPTLLIEPLGPASGVLVIDQCAREQLAVTSEPSEPVVTSGGAAVSGSSALARVISPMVTCAVTGKPGRYLVRVHHVATSIGFRTQHEIAMSARDRASISTRFAISTPAWGTRAELILHDGAPGDGAAPRVLARGQVTLDGGTAILSLAPRDVPARLVRVYAGIAGGSISDRTDPNWGKDSHHDVRVMLELDDPQLLPAPAHVRLSDGDDVYELRTAYAPDAPLPPARFVLPPGLVHRGYVPSRYPPGRRIPAISAPSASPPSATPGQAGASAASGAATAGPDVATPKHLALWADHSLRGTRKRTTERGDGTTLADRLELSITNLGAEPREVWLEEPLRPARRRELVRGRPAKPSLAGEVARIKVVVDPGKTELVSFTVRYFF